MIPSTTRRPFPSIFAIFQAAGGRVSKAHDGPEGSEIDEPVQGVPPQEGEDDGDDHDKEDAVGGLGEPFGEYPVLRHGGQDPGGGAVAADDARKDGRKGGDGHDHNARCP